MKSRGQLKHRSDLLSGKGECQIKVKGIVVDVCEEAVGESDLIKYVLQYTLNTCMLQSL